MVLRLHSLYVCYLDRRQLRSPVVITVFVTLLRRSLITDITGKNGRAIDITGEKTAKLSPRN